ncbi:hypothetical protein I4U23_016005 [Adineta vaga]|nr:hypothetical protein I4U23_016005 [Adineta vaga]
MAYQVNSTVPIRGLEKYFYADGSWTIIVDVVHLTGNRSLITTNASYTIQCLLKRYPPMRTRLRVNNNQHLLDILEYNSEYFSNDLFFSTVPIGNNTWENLVETRCNENPYCKNGTEIFPLFHFMLVYDDKQSDDQLFHLILFSNHCVADGRSGIILINDFLTLVTSPNLFEISEPNNNKTLPLIGELIPRPFGILYPLVSFIGKRIAKHNFHQLVRTRIPFKSIPLTNCQFISCQTQLYKNKFLFASTSTDVYEKLHQQCRSHELTINSSLFACLLLAVHRCFPIGKNTQLKPFEISNAFDMRMRLPGSPLTTSSVGFFVGLHELKLKKSYSIRSTQFWSLALESMSMTRNSLKRHWIPLTMHVFADLLKDDRNLRELGQSESEGRVCELGFSNLGKYPFSCDYQQGVLKIRGLHFGNNCSGYRPGTNMYVACAGDGQLDFSMVHEIETDEKAKEFFDYYIRLVETCADRTSCTNETTLEQLLTRADSR